MKKKYIQNLEISLASPFEIRDWARRPFAKGWVGEVKNWETVNYKTLKPEPNGLFCQRIFGPIKDFTCGCGIQLTKKRIQQKNLPRCPKCGVEWTYSRVRRSRLGYIDLSQPIVHTLYALQRPISPVNITLRWSLKHLKAVMYATECCFTPKHFYYRVSKCIPLQKNCEEYKSMLSRRFRKKPQLFQRTHTLTTPTKEIWTKTPTNQKSTAISFQHGLHTYGITYDITWRHIEDLYYYFSYTITKAKERDISLPYDMYKKRPTYGICKLVKQHIQPYPVETGGSALKKILSIMPISLMAEEFGCRVRESNLYKRESDSLLHLVYSNLSFNSGNEEGRCRHRFFTKRLKLEKILTKRAHRIEHFGHFKQTQTHPIWMMLDYLPVLPPGLRPLVSMNGEVVVSDINNLYRTVIIRNHRIFTPEFHIRLCRSIFNPILPATWNIWCYHLRHFQEAIDSLLKNGAIVGGSSIKSLLDGLKGKKGRFRQHLLGKRMDYSGRSVIVVGPTLKIHECGIPEQMAAELFLPFLVKTFRKNNIAITNIIAKQLLSQPNSKTWKLIEKVISQHPVLLNRAPTLHRLGIQAFFPKLVRGKAILLHPLVCPAFNADFDGDQMAVHVPLSIPARAEALTLLLSRRQLLAPASGDPLLLPTQDMVLGWYYLTILKPIPKLPKRAESTVQQKDLRLPNLIPWYQDWNHVYQAYVRKDLKIHSVIWVRWFFDVQNLLTEQQAKTNEYPLEYRLGPTGFVEKVFHDRYTTGKFLKTRSQYGYQSFEQERTLYIRTTPGRILLYTTLNSMNLIKLS